MKKVCYFFIAALFLVACASTPSFENSSYDYSFASSSNNPSATSFEFDSKYAKGELAFAYNTKGHSSQLSDGLEIEIEQLKNHRILYKRMSSQYYFYFDEDEINIERWQLNNVFVGDIDCDGSSDICINLEQSGSSYHYYRILVYSFEKKNIIYEINKKVEAESWNYYILKTNEEDDLIVEDYDSKKYVSIYPLKYGRFLNNHIQEISLEWKDYSFRVYNIEPYLSDSTAGNTKTHVDGKWGFTVSKDTSYDLLVFADLVGDINDTFEQYRENNYFDVSYDESFISQFSIALVAGNYVYTQYSVTFSKTGTTTMTFSMAGYSVSIEFIIN